MRHKPNLTPDHTLVDTLDEFYAKINNLPKEATMTLRTSTTTPNRYRYRVTIDIDALPGSLDHTSSAASLQHFLGTSTVWQQASRRNIEVGVSREILAYGQEPQRVTVQGLGDQFTVVNRYGHEFSCIKVGDRVVVNGTTGLHDFPSTLVQTHLDNGTWVVG